MEIRRFFEQGNYLEKLGIMPCRNIDVYQGMAWYFVGYDAIDEDAMYLKVQE